MISSTLRRFVVLQSLGLGVTCFVVRESHGAPPGSKLVPESSGYAYRIISRLGDRLPGGAQLSFDYESWMISNSGVLSFGADLEGGGEGVFLADGGGALREVALTGTAAPGGGIYGSYFFGFLALNELGDLAFCMTLVGKNDEGAVFRFSAADGRVEQVVPRDQPFGTGTILGCQPHVTMNKGGAIAFSAHVADGFGPAVVPGDGSGVGILLRQPDPIGKLQWVIRPGDPAPGGDTFSNAWNPWINDSGEIAFGAQLSQEFCRQNGAILCSENGIYLRRTSGEIDRIVHAGDAAPEGGRYRITWGAVLNNQGDIVFTGDLTDDPDPKVTNVSPGIFLYRQGRILAVGHPGDAFPGGGAMANSSTYMGGYFLNQRGEVCFGATLDSLHKRVTDQVDVPEQGLYLWSKGNLRLVVRTNSVVDGQSRFLALLPPIVYEKQFPLSHRWPWVASSCNDLGQVLFNGTLVDNQGALFGALLAATPAAPYFFLGHGDKRDENFDVVLSTDGETQGFSLAVMLEGDCPAVQIASIDPGPDLPAKPASWSVKLIDGGKAASVVASLPAGTPLPKDQNQRVASILLSGEVTRGSTCRLCFAEAGDPAVVPSVTAGGTTRDVPCGQCIVVEAGPTFRRGDGDVNGAIELTDAVRLLDYLYLGGPRLECLDASDFDDDGAADISDAIINLNYQFLGGPAPADPGPFNCGTDKTAEEADLGCEKSCP